MRSSISLALFTTTKGHFGFQDIYQSTVRDLILQVGPSFFADKVVHIKYEGGDEDCLKKMESFFNSYNFKIIKTHGPWKHYNTSHYLEHVKDIVTLMSDSTVQRNKFTLWMEDDFLLRTSDDNVLSAFKRACDTLDSDPNILSVRFLKKVTDTDQMQYERLQFDQQISDKIFSHNDVYTFDPNLIRSRDGWMMARMFEKFGLQMHIERQATEILRQNIPSRKNGIFSAFNLDYAKAMHIGDPTWTPEIEKTIQFS